MPCRVTQYLGLDKQLRSRKRTCHQSQIFGSLWKAEKLISISPFRKSHDLIQIGPTYLMQLRASRYDLILHWKLSEWIRDRYERIMRFLIENRFTFSRQISFLLPRQILSLRDVIHEFFQKKLNYTWSDHFPVMPFSSRRYEPHPTEKSMTFYNLKQRASGMIKFFYVSHF